MRIFIADDDGEARKLLEATLASAGYDDISTAASGLEALSQLGVNPPDAQAPNPDVILLDILMPGLDGIETCARIRADTRYQDTPILMVTALSDSSTLGQAFVAGANDYVSKPYNRVELLARLRSAMRLKGELDHRRERERELIEVMRDSPPARGSNKGRKLDPATHLLDGRIVEDCLASAERADFCAMAFQIDRLPVFRTNYGQTAEADLLARIADVLRTLPANLGDILAHYGGGIFVALLYGTAKGQLAQLAETARQRVIALAVPYRGSGSLEIVTLSIGVACDGEPRALLAGAVSRMERAGSEGGNRIIFSQADPSP